MLKGIVQADPNLSSQSANRVWSEEHGHWHNAPTGSTTSQGASSSVESNTIGQTSAPPGQAPPGKVWSEAHGHWHDAPTGSNASPGTAAPPGQAPPGKVWSEAHGHWHDAPTGSTTSPDTAASPAPQQG